MNAFMSIAGWLLLLAMIGWKAITFKTEWVIGPKYSMPVSLLAPDGVHYADGLPVDPFTLGLIRSGNEEEVWLGITGIFTFLIVMMFREFLRLREHRIKLPNGKRIYPDEAELDRELFSWNRHDLFTRRHLLNGGVLIMGRPGSGKTSASGAVIGRNIVGDPLSTMLIIAAKAGEDKRMWQRIFAQKKRELLVFEPGGNLRCNMIDFVQRMGGDTREVVSFILTATEVLRGESSGGGGEYGSFFQDEERRYLHHAVEILRQSGVAVSAPNLQRFISGAAMSKEQLNSEQWREGFHNACIRAAVKRPKTAREQHDLEMAITAWIEWAQMAQRTRSCVLAGMLNKLFYFNSGIARELISTATNCSPLDMLLKGKSILVNCPSCEFGDTGALISSCWKYLTQKVVLGREFKPGSFYNVIWGDEFWQTVTSFDQHYINTSRSHGGAVVALVQSRDSFYAALKGEDGKNFANALISGFHHKIFHALGSAEDAEYAASLLGKRRELFVSGSTQPQQDLFDAFMGNTRFSASTSEQYQPILQPKVFLSDLRSGGPNEYLADAIVIRTGEPFKSTGQNFIHATFSQR